MANPIKRKKSANELRVIKAVDRSQYYNDHIVPLAIQLKRRFEPMSASRNTALCPFHVDTDPSFHDWREGGMFRCFGCGYSGDVVRTHGQVLRQFHGISKDIKEVVQILALMYNIHLDEEHGDEVESPFQRARTLLMRPDVLALPKHEPTMLEFTTNNTKVIRADISFDMKLHNFANLDLIMSAHLSDQIPDVSDV